ncbi:RES family NAD+ phosphorylase [Streptomyces sp. NPDC059385]|uniref:RES family NAD+ phosphorylase n=1 Tax=Streptomyces sp. NPDC059385 TaxID=3346817 RepID=UPI0036A2B1A1
MPPISSPPTRPLTAHRVEFPQDTPLYRVHRKHVSSTAFNPRPAGTFTGGRFDGTPEDPYPFLYAAPTPRTAVANTVLRATSFTPEGQRLVPMTAVVNRQLTQVRTTGPLQLIDLTTESSLHAVGADPYLVCSEDFVHARVWSTVLRRHNPWAQGLLWPSRFHRPDALVVLFGDRCDPASSSNTPTGPWRSVPTSFWPVCMLRSRSLARRPSALTTSSGSIS